MNTENEIVEEAPKVEVTEQIEKIVEPEEKAVEETKKIKDYMDFIINDLDKKRDEIQQLLDKKIENIQTMIDGFSNTHPKLLIGFSKFGHWIQKVAFWVLLIFLVGVSSGIVTSRLYFCNEVEKAINLQRFIYNGVIYDVMDSPIRRKISMKDSSIPLQQKIDEIKPEVKEEPIIKPEKKKKNKLEEK